MSAAVVHACHVSDRCLSCAEQTVGLAQDWLLLASAAQPQKVRETISALLRNHRSVLRTLDHVLLQLAKPGEWLFFWHIPRPGQQKLGAETGICGWQFQ